MKQIDVLPEGYVVYSTPIKHYAVPEHHCLVCACCKDVFYDSTNGPYLWFCAFGYDSEHWTNCDSFVETKE